MLLERSSGAFQFQTANYGNSRDAKQDGETFITFMRQNEWKLPKRRRRGEFEKLTDKGLARYHGAMTMTGVFAEVFELIQADSKVLFWRSSSGKLLINEPLSFLLLSFSSSSLMEFLYLVLACYNPISLSSPLPVGSGSAITSAHQGASLLPNWADQYHSDTSVQELPRLS